MMEPRALGMLADGIPLTTPRPKRIFKKDSFLLLLVMCMCACPVSEYHMCAVWAEARGDNESPGAVWSHCVGSRNQIPVL